MALFYTLKEKDFNVVSIKDMLWLTWSKVGSFAWVAFLMGILTFLGFVIFIIPGIVIYVWLSLSLYVLVFEDIKGKNALRRSRILVKGYWWELFSRLFLFFLLVSVISIIPIIGGLIKVLFLMPLGVIYGYLIYEDLKRVKSIRPVA